MTRDEKAALRARARERRRRPSDEEPRDEQPGDEQPDDGEPPRQEEPEPEGRERRLRSASRPQRAAARSDVPDIAGQAREVLRSLKGVDAESVSGLSATPQGWKVTLEVLELRRIPESTDVLASYEVELDGDGRMLRFERGRRYHRAQADKGGGA